MLHISLCSVGTALFKFAVCKAKGTGTAVCNTAKSTSWSFNEINMHEAVAHPNQAGWMMMFGSESVHLELFILGKG